MYPNSSDTRIPLPPQSVVEIAPDRRYVIDRLLSADDLSLLYLARREDSGVNLVLRELFPRGSETLFAQRQEGKIQIWNPAAEEDIPAEPERMLHQEQQAAQAVGIGARGPFADSLGNLYLELEAAPEESLADYLRGSFLRSPDGQPLSNPLLSEIISLLADAAGQLSDTCKTTGILHGNLSPENIFLTPADGVCVLGFGRTDSRNPHAAPADSGEVGCVWSLSSILLYAATGRLAETEGWQARILREYAPGTPENRIADSFAGALTALLARGLGAGFSGLDSFRDALLALAEKNRPYDDLLTLVPPDELMSYMVLEKHPLYRYRGEDGNIHVLCLGSGVFARRMILSLISCGQIIDSHLHIHIVSNSPRQELWDYLRTAAPELEKYSNLSGTVEEEYVTFRFHQTGDLLEPGIAREVLKEHPDARYLLISLGSRENNAAAAALYARLLAEENRPETIINYYGTEQLLPAASDRVQVDAFADDLDSYSATLRELGRRTLRVAHLYNKLSNPRISLSQTARELSRDSYSQCSSCASALHLKYKLAGVGLNPEDPDRAALIGEYRKVLESSRYGKLLRSEHDRWMMYLVSEQFRTPTPEELNRYGYAMVDGKFNAGWKCATRKLHPILVPCSDAGITLTAEDWQRYSTREAIAAAPFDPLDKASLLLHLKSEEKCRQILREDTLGSAFAAISAKMDAAVAEAGAEPEEEADTLHLRSLQKQLRTIREDISVDARNLQEISSFHRLQVLQSSFASIGLDISAEITGLKQSLSVFREYAAHKDYKTPDDAIIRNIPWLLYGDEDVTLIKLKGRTIADNITAPLILEPGELVYYGLQPQHSWVSFLHSHGYFGRIRFVPGGGGGVEEQYRALQELIAGQNRPCVVDITGADEAAVVAVHRLCEGNSRVSMIRSHPDGWIENIHNFPAAGAYTLNTVIAAEEIYGLHGAARNAEESHYMEQLEDLAPALWQVYQEFKDDWNMVTAFFHARGAGSSELWVRNIRLDASTRWQRYSRRVDKVKWNALELGEAFRKLADAGILRNFSARETAPGRMDVVFLYPLVSTGTTSDFMLGALNSFFGYKVNSAMAPFRCEITHSLQNGFTVSLSTGCRVDIYERSTTEYTDTRYQSSGGRARYPYAEVIPALKRLEEAGLIMDLRVPDYPDSLPIRISFVYPNPAVRTCLATAGNALELYIWHEARRMRFFDDVQSNFSFAWREGVSNELDVILTRGLTSLIISAKSARYNKEHLYEIRYLTERFSLNSRSVIVYSSDRAFLDGRLTTNLAPVKNRARAMGVYLIDLNELDCSLGEKLVRIARGEDQP